MMKGFVLTWLVASACASSELRPEPPPAVGRAMALVLPRVDAGKAEFDLAALRGRVVLVDVWASWCTACRDAIPAWDGLRKRVGTDHVEVVGLSTDAAREDAAAFVAELEPPLESSVVMLWDDGRFVRSFPVRAMPSLFVLDRDGVVRFTHAGFDRETPGLVEAEVRGLLDATHGGASTSIPQHQPEGAGVRSY